MWQYNRAVRQTDGFLDGRELRLMIVKSDWISERRQLSSLIALAFILISPGCTETRSAALESAPVSAPAFTDISPSLPPPLVQPHADLVASDGDDQTYMVPMRDGVRLSTHVYGAKRGEMPVLMMRTPYGSGGGKDVARVAELAGYNVVVQDVRGRFESGGDFGMMFKEGVDGYDTIEWTAAQPWCNGKIGMLGGSYLGIVQWAAAIESPPHLTCIFPVVAPADFYSQMAYQGGALRQELTQGWLEGVASSSPWWKQHKAEVSSDPGINASAPQWMTHLPLTDPGPIARGGPTMIRFWTTILAHDTDDPMWHALSPSYHYDRVKIPALIMGGWYDIFNQGCVDNFLGVKQHGGTDLARDNVHLLMGPYDHDCNPKVGDRDFGAVARTDQGKVALLWFNHWLKGENNGVDQWPAVRTFDIGENRWIDRPSWPPADAKAVEYFLSAGTGPHGGDLTSEPAIAQAPTLYIFNPANPVRTTGGANLTIPKGIANQAPVEQRADVLVFSGPPLTQAVHVAGRVHVHLWASMSTPETDFTAKLVDVDPSGYAANVLDGIVRTRPHGLKFGNVPAKPGPEEHLIDLWTTEYTFLPGHRIRVEVSSSDFPRFSRNLNTGANSQEDTGMQAANVVVYHDRAHPSSIELPVIPK